MDRPREEKRTHIFVLDVLEKFELAIGTLAENRSAERLHDLLDRDGGACELVLCGTGDAGEAQGMWGRCQTDHTRPKAPVRKG